MAVEIAGFAQALARCQVFESVDAGELENVLSSGQEPLEMLFVKPSADEALIRSGEPFRHLYFVQHGMIVPWQYPHSELSSPFLIGDHEFMMNAERWVASYSAATEATVVGIPVSTMRLAVERMPQIRSKICTSQSCRARRSRGGLQHSPPLTSSASGTTIVKGSQGSYMSRTLTD